MSGPRLSPRLAAVVDALPLRPGMRVLEVGGAPGTAARAVAQRVGDGHVLVIDRSAKGVAAVERTAAREIAAGLLSVRRCAAEEFVLLPGEAPFDLAFAVRVGAFDGRHPEAGAVATQRVAAALSPTGRFLVGDGAGMDEVELPHAGEPGSRRPRTRSNSVARGGGRTVANGWPARSPGSSSSTEDP